MTTKSLIVYFSQTGNTKVVADKIQKLTGSDIFRLQATIPYKIHRVMQFSYRVDVEGKTAAFPSIKEKVPNWQDYSTIYLGFPVWFWGAPTRIMAAFFRDYDFTDKVVAPFYTSYSTSEQEAIGKLKQMAKSSNVKFLPGFQYLGDDRKLEQWLKSLNPQILDAENEQ